MSIYFVHVGGGKIGRDHATNPLGQYFPAGLPSCCNVGLPEAALYYDPKYVVDFAPVRNVGLGCYLAGKTIAAGDKFVVSMVHAGADAHTLSVRNRNGCAGSTYHFELHDVYALAAESAGGAASVAEVVFPTITADTALEKHFDIRKIFGDAYYGDMYGEVTVNGQSVCCQKHKALVLVLDTLPDAGATPKMGCGPTTPCNIGPSNCGSSPLDCLDIGASVHVYIPGGLRNT